MSEELQKSNVFYAMSDVFMGRLIIELPPSFFDLIISELENLWQKEPSKILISKRNLGV